MQAPFSGSNLLQQSLTFAPLLFCFLNKPTKISIMKLSIVSCFRSICYDCPSPIN